MVMIPTPPFSVAAPTPRGSFRVSESYPGVSTFESLTCQGHLYERRELPDHMVGDGEWVMKQMDANLSHDDVCPVAPEKHGPTCPFDRRRLGVLAMTAARFRDGSGS
jgi:hypothetical protein